MRGEDITALQTRLGCTAHDMAFVLGIIPAQYYKLTNRTNARKPLPLAIALNVRFLTLHPEFSPLPPQPDPREFFEFCRTIDPNFSPGKLAVLATRSRAAAYRWFRTGPSPAPLRPAVARWILTAWQALREAPAKDRPRVLRELFGIVADEAETRGYNRGALLAAQEWAMDEDAVVPAPDVAVTYVPGARASRRAPAKASKKKPATKRGDKR